MYSTSRLPIIYKIDMIVIFEADIFILLVSELEPAAPDDPEIRSVKPIGKLRKFLIPSMCLCVVNQLIKDILKKLAFSCLKTSFVYLRNIW